MRLFDAPRRRAGFAPVFLLAAACSSICCAQTPPGNEALQKQIDELRQQQEATQKELSELKELLEPVTSQLPQPFKPQDVTIAGSPMMGQADAPVTMIEFSDLQCPYCMKYYKETFPSIVKEFVKTNKLRYVVREFPLAQIHPRAQAASRAEVCAISQNKYWEIRDQIFNNRDKLSDDDLAGYAKASGLDMEKWKSCLGTDLYTTKVDTDLKAGQALGVSGTPGFVLGLTDPTHLDKILATKLIEGAYPFEAFQKTIQDLLDSGH